MSSRRIDKETFFQRIADMEEVIEVAVKRPDGLMLGSVISADVDEETGELVSVNVVSRITLEGAELDQLIAILEESGQQTTWLPLQKQKMSRVK